MSSVSTHVLDLVTGRPAAGVRVRLSRIDPAQGGARTPLAEGITDADGRVRELVPKDRPVHGTFEIVFETGAWCAARQTPCFYPFVPIVFTIPEEGSHYHVPLLLGPYGYSTYRGS